MYNLKIPLVERALAIALFSLLMVVDAVGGTTPEPVEGFNIDFGVLGETPEQDYAAAGHPGFWNPHWTLEDWHSGDLERPRDLSGEGAAWLEDVVISFDDDLFPVSPSAQPFSPTDALLLGDYIVSGSNDFEIVVRGLPADTYTFYFYAVGRQDFPAATMITPLNPVLPAVEIDGIWPDVYQEGQSYARFTVSTDGQQEFAFRVASPNDAFINGLQVIRGSSDSVEGLEELLSGDLLDWTFVGAGSLQWPLEPLGYEGRGSVGLNEIPAETTVVLSAIVPTAGHLEFFWTVQPEDAATVDLSINGEIYLEFDENDGVHSDRHQFYLAEPSLVEWTIRNPIDWEMPVKFRLSEVDFRPSQINSAPVLTGYDGQEAFTLLVDEYGGTAFRATDSDGDTPLITLKTRSPDTGTLPERMSLTDGYNGFASYNGFPNWNEAGRYVLEVSANDNGSEVSKNFPMTVKRNLPDHMVVNDSDFTSKAELFPGRSSALISSVDGTRFIASDRSAQQALVYELSSAGAWSEIAAVDLPDGFTGLVFPNSTAIDGDLLAVSSSRSFNPSDIPDHLFLFRETSPGIWALEQDLEIPYQGISNSSHAIALHDSWLAIGSRNYRDENNSRVGILLLYYRNATGQWQLHQEFPGGSSSSFGESLSFSESAGTLRLAAGVEFQGTSSDSGEVTVYELQADQHWNAIDTLSPAATGSRYSTFGRDVSLDGATLLVADKLRFPNGVVYVYEWTGAQFQLRQEMVEDWSGQTIGGSAILLDGDQLFIGDSWSDLFGVNNGLIVRYRRNPSTHRFERELVFGSSREKEFAYVGERHLFLAGKQLWGATPNGLYAFNPQTFVDWLNQRYPDFAGSSDDGAWLDLDENGRTEALDYLQSQSSSPASLRHRLRTEADGEQFFTFELDGHLPPGLPWTIEASYDLIDWADSDVVIINSGEPSIWGVPVGTHDAAFLRFNPAPSE